MKIKVSDLEPNPFRKMKDYPIDRSKVNALKTSIKEKTFWDNILVRPHPTQKGKYQLAYGHHRYIAIKELGIKEIDIPVRDLDDSLMVRIMAEENLNWSTSTAVMVQTVLTVKEYLDAELQKYKTLEEYPAEINRVLFKGSKGDFLKCKKIGVGRPTLVKFLGGNWTGYKVDVALKIINDENLDESAITIPTLGQARVFHKSVTNHKIPKPIQKKLVNQIIKEDIGKRDIPDLVADHSIISIKKEKPEPKPLPMLDDYIKEICGLMNTLRQKLQHIKDNFENIQSKRLKETFLRDGKELNTFMEGIFKNETEEKKTKRIL